MTAVTSVTPTDFRCRCEDAEHARRFPGDHVSPFPSAMEAARMHIMGYLDLEWMFQVGEPVEMLEHAGPTLAGLVGKISEIKPVQVVVGIPMSGGEILQVQVMYHMVAKIPWAMVDVPEEIAA